MKEAGVLSMKNKIHVQTSRMCGCYYCGHIFPATDVTQWTDAGQTALCPKCFVDAVLCDSQQVTIDTPTMQAAHLHWFFKSTTATNRSP